MNLIDELNEAARQFQIRVDARRPQFVRPVSTPITSSSRVVTIEKEEEIAEFFADKRKFVAKLLRDGR